MHVKEYVRISKNDPSPVISKMAAHFGDYLI